MRNGQDFLYNLFRKRKTDLEYFEEIGARMYKAKENGVNTYVVYTILGLINKLGIKPKKILDFGCGDCGIVEALGKELGLEKDSIFGTDIKDTFEQSWNATRVNKDITFEFTDFSNVVPFKEKFDIIMALMVFHHIEEPAPIIREIYNSLNKGGVLIIREHDCSDKYDGVFADLVHSLYIIQNNGVVKDKIFAQQNYYRSADQWSSIFKAAGFAEIYVDRDALSTTKNYRAVYKK